MLKRAVVSGIMLTLISIGLLSSAWSIILTPIPATIDIYPDPLNLIRQGEWVTSYIELPEDCNVSDINVTTLMLNETIPAEPSSTTIGDYDNDTIPDLMVEFNRTDVSDFIYSQGIRYGNVALTVEGELLNGTLIEGTDVIQVRMPGDINIDGMIDIGDAIIASIAFGSYPGHPAWNSTADENEDNVVDIIDIIVIAREFGKVYP